MIRKPRVCAVFLIGILALVTRPTPAMALQVIPQLGVAKAVGEDTDDVRVGFSAGADVLYGITLHVAVGIHGAFTYFPVDGDFPEIYYSGSLEIVELTPLVRVTTAPEQGPSFFGQLGIGLYMADGVLRGAAFGESFEVRDETDELGMHLGGGVVFGRGQARLELAPVLHLVFSEGETTKYFVFQIRVGLGVCEKDGP